MSLQKNTTQELRNALINWLETNDRNGCYSDEDCIAEFGRTMTTGEAIASVFYHITEA